MSERMPEPSTRATKFSLAPALPATEAPAVAEPAPTPAAAPAPAVAPVRAAPEVGTRGSQPPALSEPGPARVSSSPAPAAAPTVARGSLRRARPGATTRPKASDSVETGTGTQRKAAYSMAEFPIPRTADGGVDYHPVANDVRIREPGSTTSFVLWNSVEFALVGMKSERYAQWAEQGLSGTNTAAFRDALTRLGLKYFRDDPEFEALIEIDGRARRHQ